MALTHKIAANTIYQIAGKAISMSITILATVIITRTYGRTGYGEFNLMQVWPALFFIIIDFGLNAIATRELSKNPDDTSLASKYIGNILLFRIVLSLFFVVFLSAMLMFFPYSHMLKIGIAINLLQILTQALYTTLNIVFQTHLRYDYSTIGYLSGYLLILVLILVLSFLNAPVMLVGFSYVIGGVLTYFINLKFLHKLNIFPVLRIDKEVLTYLLIQALPLGLMFIFSQISFKSDSLLMSVLKLPSQYNLTNTESIAVYGLAYKIFEVALVIPTFLMNSVYPILVRHMEESKEKLKNTFFKSMAFLLVSGVVFGLVGILFSSVAINFLGGAEFEQSVLVLKILLAGLFLYYLTQPISWLIVTLGNQRILPIIYLVSAIFNVSANYYFIPRYSFYASSVITHISEFIVLVLLAFAAHKTWKAKYAD